MRSIGTQEEEDNLRPWGDAPSVPARAQAAALPVPELLSPYVTRAPPAASAAPATAAAATAACWQALHASEC